MGKNGEENKLKDIKHEPRRRGKNVVKTWQIKELIEKAAFGFKPSHMLRAQPEKFAFENFQYKFISSP
jgi:hypothetical protein